MTMTIWEDWLRDYILIGKLNPDKTPETPDLSGLTRSDCIE